jgi:xylulokinase
VSQGDLFVGIDSSTTACKAIAFDSQGEAVAEGRADIALDNPAPEAWEQDAEAWWRALGEACRGLVARLGPRASEVRAACITNQRETVVVTNDVGVPLAPALVWMDGRGTAEVDRAKAQIGAARLHEISGKPACTTPSLYKLMALFRRQPGLAAQRPRVLDVHGFLAWRLTGEFATSLAAADPMGVIDMPSRDYADELLSLLEVERSQLPALLRPGSKLGGLTTEAADHTSLAAGLPLIAGAGDGQCAGLGAGITSPGRAYLNLGTAVVSGVLSASYRCDEAFRTLYSAAPDGYFLETDLQAGTFSLRWLVADLLGTGEADIESKRAALEASAAQLPVGAEGLLFMPYLNGVMNPYWDDDASAMLFGLRGHHGSAHVYRAVLEGIALEQRLHLEGVEAAVGQLEEIVVVGGGSKSSLWCQMMADVLGRSVVRAGTSEATALGAAILAAVAGGAYPDTSSAAAAMTRLAERFDPDSTAAARYGQLYESVYRGLYTDVAARMAKLAAFRRA